ncbi:MAG: type II toxin-antitoxin system VapC family toxin [Deltaproteobacteria bacterium]|nr:type II toxin-antitoxin system VapC family toxin [Deltaproteobacteria bacterium]
MILSRVFVGTGAWFALQVEDDKHHVAARTTFPVLLQACRSVVTSNLIVGETYTLLRTTKGHAEAKRFLDTLARSPKLERLFVTQSVERQAYDLLHRYAEHPFSFVDATSFVLARQQRIRHAFAFDRHFAVAGFLRIPDDLQL